MANEPEVELPVTEDDGGPIKSFLEHLEDLRWALMKSAVAVAVAVLICLAAGNYVVRILYRPLEKALVNYPPENQVVVFSFGTNRLGTFQLNPQQQAALNLGKDAVSPAFVPGDILDLWTLARKLHGEDADGISKLLGSRIGAGTNSLLAEYTAKKELEPPPWWKVWAPNHSLTDPLAKRLQTNLVDQLNAVMAGPALARETNFQNLKLRPITEEFRKKTPDATELKQLNRLLLEDAYPELLARNQSQFLAMELTPQTIPSGTNLVQVMGWKLDISSDARDKAQHMGLSLITLGPAQAFLVGFQVALYAGIALASPFIFLFMGQFIFPALRIKERMYLYKGLAFAVPLFICGVTFCYFVLMPAALAAAQMYANWFGFVSNFWEAGEYISFVSKFMLGMGLGFEMPVVILILVKIGILSYSTLKMLRPYMIVINLVLGAVLTTPEVFTQVLMAVPLQFLYEISVWIAWYWERRDRKKAEAEARAGGK